MKPYYDELAKFNKTNKEIITYLGWKKSKKEISYFEKNTYIIPIGFSNPCSWFIDEDEIDIIDTAFQLSWDWLEKVIEKIEYDWESTTREPVFNINAHWCEINVPGYKVRYGCYPGSELKTKYNSKIEAAYFLILNFIRFLKKQKCKE